MFFHIAIQVRGLPEVRINGMLPLFPCGAAQTSTQCDAENLRMPVVTAGESLYLHESRSIVNKAYVRPCYTGSTRQFPADFHSVKAIVFILVAHARYPVFIVKRAWHRYADQR